MPKPDELITEVGPFQVFRKAEGREYEIVGPGVQNSPLSYTMIRTTPEYLDRIREAVRADARKNK